MVDATITGVLQEFCQLEKTCDSILPSWFSGGFGSMSVSIVVSSSMYMSSDEAREWLLPSINLIKGDRERARYNQLNYIIFAICYPLFATHTLKGP